MDLSVIVPIYKVECFIQICAKSLMEQTVSNIEYIFVDDCSPDNSVALLNEVIDKYPHRKEWIKIVSHKQNKGLPAARNTGLQYATGKYIYHCDSDDILETDALELLLNSAEVSQADIVWCDWFLSFEHNERYMKQPQYATAGEALKGILLGRMKYNVWNKLVRRSLYDENHILFPNGHSMGEDMTMIRLFACASKVAYVSKALYHYVKTNGAAFTNSLSENKLRDIMYNTTETIKFLTDKFGQTLHDEIACFKLNVKYPFLISEDPKMYVKWLEWFSEANAYILRNKGVSWRCRFLQYAASKKQFWLVWVHYKCMYRFMYGFIYK